MLMSTIERMREIGITKAIDALALLVSIPAALNPAGRAARVDPVTAPCHD